MNRLPFRVTLLMWLVLTMIVWNSLRLWTALAWQGTLIEFSVRPAPWVTALSSGIWIVTGIFILWSIWQRKAWTVKLLFGAAAVYTVWYWSERLIWQQPHPNWPFAVIVNLIVLVFIFYTIKPLARETHERKSQDPKNE